jgi:hypothetical protein
MRVHDFQGWLRNVTITVRLAPSSAVTEQFWNEKPEFVRWVGAPLGGDHVVSVSAGVVMDKKPASLEDSLWRSRNAEYEVNSDLDRGL